MLSFYVKHIPTAKAMMETSKRVPLRRSEFGMVEAERLAPAENPSGAAR